jgi:hypothetical protein
MIREYQSKSYITDKEREQRLASKNRLEAETITERYSAAELKTTI